MQAMGNVEELDLATRMHQTHSDAEGAAEPRERQEDLEADMTKIGSPEKPPSIHTTIVHVLAPNLGLTEPKIATATM